MSVDFDGGTVDPIELSEVAMLREKVKALEKKNLVLENKLESFKPLSKMFQPVDKQGNKFRYTDELTTCSVKMIADGESGGSVRRFFGCLIETFPACFPDANAETLPTAKWFCDLRYTVPTLNKWMIEQFVTDSKDLFLSVDGTPDLTGADCLGIGLQNEFGKFLGVGLGRVVGKTGINVADQVMQQLETELGDNFETFVQKCSVIISDQCPAQLKANRLLLDRFNDINPAARFFQPCYMHTSMHLENQLIEKLSKCTRSFLTDLKILFGNPSKCGYRPQCLRQCLLDKIQSSRSGFKTDLGKS